MKGNAFQVYSRSLCFCSFCKAASLLGINFGRVGVLSVSFSDFEILINFRDMGY